MILHFDIEHKAKTLKPGFGFDAFKFATEHNLTGNITYGEDHSCKVQLEGKKENIVAFIGWFFADELKDDTIESLVIKSGQLMNYKEFTINNVCGS